MTPAETPRLPAEETGTQVPGGLDSPPFTAMALSMPACSRWQGTSRTRSVVNWGGTGEVILRAVIGASPQPDDI